MPVDFASLRAAVDRAEEAYLAERAVQEAAHLVPELPFAMPSRAEMSASARKVIACYHTIPLYWREGSTLFEDSIRPNGGDYSDVGGRWRQRPHPLVSNVGLTDEKRVGYCHQDITTAAAIGIDGFAVNLIGTSTIGETWRWFEHLLPLYAAAERFSAETSPGFTLSPNVSALAVARKATAAERDPVAWADDIAPLLRSAAAQRHNGRPVVHIYNVLRLAPSWYTAFAGRLSNAHGIDAALIPSYQGNSPSDLDAYLPLFQAGRMVALHVWATNRYSVAPEDILTPFRTWATDNGVPFMGGVGPTWENDRPDLLKEHEGWGLKVLQNMWQANIVHGDPMVQIVSWNDHEESHNIRPSTGYQWVPYDVTAYYLAWYKTGTPPPITRDALFYVHRMHLGGAPYDATRQTAGAFNVNNGPAADKVFTYAFLTAPADVVVTTGGLARSHAAPAGLSAWEDPMAAPDVPKFKAVRDGVSVIPQFPSDFPTRTGIAWQDLLYRMGGSNRPPVPGVQGNLPQDRFA